MFVLRLNCYDDVNCNSAVVHQFVFLFAFFNIAFTSSFLLTKLTIWNAEVTFCVKYCNLFYNPSPQLWRTFGSASHLLKFSIWGVKLVSRNLTNDRSRGKWLNSKTSTNSSKRILKLWMYPWVFAFLPIF